MTSSPHSSSVPIQEALDVLYHVSAGHRVWSPQQQREYVAAAREALQSLEEQLEAYEHALSFIADWPTKLFPASVTAYTPMVVHDCAARALQRASNPASERWTSWTTTPDVRDGPSGTVPNQDTKGEA